MKLGDHRRARRLFANPTTKAVAVPIYQTTRTPSTTPSTAPDLFDLKVRQHLHPHHEPDHRGAGAASPNSKAASARSPWPPAWPAITYAIQTIAEAGDNIVGPTLYGGTYNLFAHTFPQFGIEVRFADSATRTASPAHRRAHQGDLLRIGRQPAGNVTDIGPPGRDRAHGGVPLIVDNTVPNPYLCRPFEHGADIVVHALTKYQSAATATRSAASSSIPASSPWAEHKARFKRLNEPGRRAYHGVVYTEALGAAAFIGRARGAAAQHRRGDLALQQLPDPAGHRDPGAAHGPHLHQHDQGRRVPEARQGRWVNYAVLPTTPTTPWCRSTWRVRPGILSFRGQGRRYPAARRRWTLKLFTRLVNIGDAKSLA